MTKIPMDRRAVLTTMGAAVLTPALPNILAAANMETLALFGPPAGPSITLSHAVATGVFNDITETASFTAWRTPDELRAGLTSGSMELAVVPIQAAANLYNRGFGLKLANVMTDGLLSIITDKTEIASIASLKGYKIAVPFRGDTPEIILNQLFAHENIDREADVTLSYTGTPIEAMQMLLAGRVDAALVAEPAASGAIMRGKMAGKTISRGVDIQVAWGEMTGQQPVLPQAGLIATNSFLEKHGDMMPAILGKLQNTVVEVLADPSAAAANASAALGMPAPVLASSIPFSKLVARSANDARIDIEAMLSAMAGVDMDKIGGKLPDDGFYL